MTGHSGRFFLQELIENEYKEPIRCIIRESSDTSAIDNSGLNIEKVVGNLEDPGFVSSCMIGVSTVFHIVNIRFSKLILEEALKHNVSRVICVHTTGIYSRFKMASGEYKDIEKAIEQMVIGSDLKLTILRPTMIFGDLCDHNISRFINMIDKFFFFPVIDHGNSLIQPVNARDLGKAYYQILSMPSEFARTGYVLSGEKPYRLVDVFRLISKYLRKKTVLSQLSTVCQQLPGESYQDSDIWEDRLR